MTKIQVFENGELVGNSIPAEGGFMPGSALPDNIKQALCDKIAEMKASGEIDRLRAEQEQEAGQSPGVAGPDMQALKAQMEQEQQPPTPDLPESPIVHRLEIDGQAWFPVQMDFALECMAGMLCRDSDGQLNLTNPQTFRKFTAALLFCGLAKSEQDERPHFATFDAAVAFAKNPLNKVTVSKLFGSITSLNPTLLESEPLESEPDAVADGKAGDSTAGVSQEKKDGLSLKAI